MTSGVTMDGGFEKTLSIVTGEMEEVVGELEDLDVALDPDGEGTVQMPVALFFQILGIMTWISGRTISYAPEEEKDGNDPS